MSIHRFIIFLLAAATTLSSILVIPLLPGGGGNLIPADLLFLIAILISGTCAARSPIFISKPVLLILFTLFAFLIHGFLSFSIAQFVSLPNPIAIVTVLNYVYGSLIAFTIILTVRNENDLLMILKGWIIGGLIVSLVSTLAVVGMAPSWAYHSSRISSTLRSVNQVQSYLGPAFLIMLFVLYLKTRGAWKVISTAGLPLAVVGMLATGSRTPIIMMIFILGFAFIRSIVSFKNSPFVNSVIISIIISFLFLIADVLMSVLRGSEGLLPIGLTQPLKRIVQKFLAMLEHSNIQDSLGPRGEQIAVVMDTWHERIFFGMGPGNFEHISGFGKEVHSTYFGILVEHGLIGLGLFMMLILINFIYLWRSKDSFRSSRVMSILLLGIISVILLYAASSFGIRQRGFWIALGLCLAQINISSLKVPLRWRKGAESQADAATSLGRVMR